MGRPLQVGFSKPPVKGHVQTLTAMDELINSAGSGAGRAPDGQNFYPRLLEVRG
jgi:hypothetical protein